MSENVLNSETWKIEAKAVINDVESHVKHFQVSKKLPCTDAAIYFNLITLENRQFCVELSPKGFRICGHEFDTVIEQKEDETFFETPYSLLNSISAKFHESFAEDLVRKLSGLQDEK